MKKIIIILSVLVTLSLAGALYGTQDRSDKGETATVEQVYMNQFPVQIPDVILYPMVGFSVY
jgi:hypothetical protein